MLPKYFVCVCARVFFLDMRVGWVYLVVGWVYVCLCVSQRSSGRHSLATTPFLLSRHVREVVDKKHETLYQYFKRAVTVPVHMVTVKRFFFSLVPLSGVCLDSETGAL